MLDVPAPRGTLRERSYAGAARLLAAVLAFAGLVGLLRVGGSDFSSAGTEDLVRLTVHPLTTVVWLVMGLVGVAMSVDPHRSRLYLIGAGGLLVLWSLISIVTGGSSDFFTTDAVNLAAQLILGVGALAVALGPTPEVVEKALAPPDPDVETD